MSTLAQQYGKARLGLPGWSPTMLGLEVRPLRADQSCSTSQRIGLSRSWRIWQRGLDLS
jgi:hypothetical protein